MLPEFVFATAVIEVVVEVPDHPLGNVQVYEVAPLTPDIEYVFDVPLHTTLFPEIAPGCAVIEFTLIVALCALLTPHELTAETSIVPPETPTVSVMVFVEDVPVQPNGEIQL